ncbi:hypothetical protein [Pragia fontium]|uniref:Uncharacterized protein n=2 Tax=Pragia fontium TaxID=82985 RepID=A0AAJ4W9N5_9GAMM|nr:hypothetical protein [Pragia fontium]AKJ43300.1 hypothetical protein QQ39_15560 [Pragia fontium]SFC58879.1 hypothetical protein SAMN02745723_10344 [Pragia fontium DSM 5563 = ATCC 49100]SUB83763.1 Uncharacterised protein [Pragia fontium]VEJ56669.1 Uncharacterised protein [Pragia fontium]GKX64124.1 hypothetical protein SOASR032_26930 [Pragia fontium]
MNIDFTDYLISAVHYSHSGGCIERVYVHENQDGHVGDYTAVSPQWVVQMINLGYTFSTISQSEDGGWIKGRNVIVDNVDGVDCIKI